jgi:hypothetical protein
MTLPRENRICRFCRYGAKGAKKDLLPCKNKKAAYEFRQKYYADVGLSMSKEVSDRAPRIMRATETCHGFEEAKNAKKVIIHLKMSSKYERNKHEVAQ